MSYQVLARRLRPKDFHGLVGQEHVVRALCNGLDSGRVHHAYLFTGTRGVGKTTVARVLAKCLNCEAGVSSTPCGTCSICREIEENRFMDLIEVDAASRTRVDDTRELLDNAQYLPSRGRYKVYLIDEVHMLSASSFNAFLKTLEEPPEHVKFLLATTEPKKVPVTVLSRCLQFQLKNIGRDEIARYIGEVLAGEGVEFEPDAVRVIAKSAQGSMRDALSITDQAIAYSRGKVTADDVVAMVGAAGRDETAAVIEALSDGDARQVLQVSAALAEKSADFGSVLAELLEALHEMAVQDALGESTDAALSPEAVQLYYQIALIGYRDLHVGPDPKTCFEMTLLRMLAFAPDAAAAASVPPTVNAEREPPGTAAPAAAGRANQSPRETRELVAARAETTQSTPEPHRAPAEIAQPASESSSAATEIAQPASESSSAATEIAQPASESSSAATEIAQPASESSSAATEIAQPASESSSAATEIAQPASESSSAATETAQPASVSDSAPAEITQPAGGPSPIEQPASVSMNPDGNALRQASDNGLAREWCGMVERLGLEGIDRMVAEHSQLVGLDTDSCRLLLDRQHAMLLKDGQAPALEQALTGLLGKKMQLLIEVGETLEETPAQRNARLLQERQEAARQSLEANSTVQSLIETFNGRLENVRPLA